MIKIFKYIGFSLEKIIAPQIEESQLSQHERDILNFDRILTGLILSVIVPSITFVLFLLWFYST